MRVGCYNPKIPRCQYINTDGTQCGSPAQRAHRHCYFHTRWCEQTIAVKSPNATYDYLRLPVLEDGRSVQIAITQVLARLLGGEIEHKTAALVLYGLQTASSNLRNIQFEPSAHDVVIDPDTVDETLMGERVWENSDFDADEDDEDEEKEEKEEKQEGGGGEAQVSNEEVGHQEVSIGSAPAHVKVSQEAEWGELRRQITAMVKNAAPALVAACIDG